MNQSSLAELATNQPPAVARKAPAVIRRVRAWAEKYSPSLQSRVTLVSMIFTAAAPFASEASLSLAAKLGVWVGAVDDLFDEHLIPPAALVAATAVYAERAAGGGRILEPDADLLGGALEDILTELAVFPLFEALRERWAGTLTQTFDAMAWEDGAARRYQAVRTPAALPTYDEYIQHGRISVAVPLASATSMVTSDDDSVLARGEFMNRLEVEAGTSARLANDLGTFAKEVEEGKLNSLTIRHAEFKASGVPESVAWLRARVAIRAESVAALGRAERAAGLVKTESGHPEAAVLGLASVVAGMYERYDFDTDLRDRPAPSAGAAEL